METQSCKQGIAWAFKYTKDKLFIQCLIVKGQKYHSIDLDGTG
jgi:hypothetical protein